MKNLQHNNNETPIKNCVKLHMFAYLPDGSIKDKENLCSCCSCLCIMQYQKSTLLPPEFIDTIENVDNLSHSDFEGNVLHNDILFNLLISGAVIPLYSPTNPRELFFLCKLIGICHADSDNTDYYNHFVAKGTKFIKCYTI